MQIPDHLLVRERPEPPLEKKKLMTVTVARTFSGSVPSKHLISYQQMHKRSAGFVVRREIVTKSALVYHARNQAVETFMQEMPPDDYLMFFDEDMIFSPDTIDKLVAHRLPLVGGLYFMKSPPWWPLLFRYKTKLTVPHPMYGETGMYDIIGHWTDGELLRVDAMGCGCMLIHRTVLETVPPPWFSFAEGTEDLFFCRKALHGGFKPHVDTSVLCGHLTMLPIGYEHYKMWLAAKARGAEAPETDKAIAYLATRAMAPAEELPAHILEGILSGEVT